METSLPLAVQSLTTDSLPLPLQPFNALSPLTIPAAALASLPRTAAVRALRPDKIASVAGRLFSSLDTELTVSLAPLAPRAGDLVVAKVLNENPAYDRLELISGRSAKFGVGDIIVGALGARRALRGYVGDVPKELAVGDELALLNMGGVIGRCTGFNQSLGQAVRLEYLGAVCQSTFTDAADEPIGDFADAMPIANVDDACLPALLPAATGPAVVAIVGSCMHAGKTRVATELVRRFTNAGWRVAAGKTSGIACLKDTLEMRDHGAVQTLSFLDLGLASTVGLSSLAGVARSLIAHLSTSAPDLIILELGDGLLGGYNVGSVLDEPLVRQRLGALVFCASDFVGAWGGIELLARRGLRADVISGAVTDSRMGVDFVRQELGVPAANAVVGGAALFALVEARLQACQHGSAP